MNPSFGTYKATERYQTGAQPLFSQPFFFPFELLLLCFCCPSSFLSLSSTRFPGVGMNVVLCEGFEAGLRLLVAGSLAGIASGLAGITRGPTPFAHSKSQTNCVQHQKDCSDSFGCDWAD